MRFHQGTMAQMASVWLVILRAAMSRNGTLLPWPLTSRIFAESVVREALADIGDVIDEGVALDGNRAGKIEMVHVEGVIDRRHQNGFVGHAFDGQTRHFGGGEHVGHERQMRPVLLDGSHRKHADAVLGDGLANFGPGEFFVAILLGHVS